MIELESIPRVSVPAALDLAEREYGLTGSLAPLPSERDQNFLLTSPAGRFVLKIANREDTPEFLDFQHGAMRRAAEGLRGCRVQELVPARSGAEIVTVRCADGSRHLVRLMRFIEGEILGGRTTRGAALLESIGECMARLDLALEGYSHPAMHRTLQWDLKHAGLARQHVVRLPPTRRAQVLSLFETWSRIDWRHLPHGVIHGDANDYNLLIESDRLVGLLDFGDIVHSAVVCDLAIALAYSVLHEPDPLHSMTAAVRAYHRTRPLDGAEQGALPALVLARLATSVCYSAFNRSRTPDDAYQVVSEAAVWSLLDALERCPPGELEECVRAACARS